MADNNDLDHDGVEEEGVDSSLTSGQNKIAVKFLVSNGAAGTIIGKGGAARTELQESSGARVQLSSSDQFQPGTRDRILLLSGTIKAVLTALHLIMAKLASSAEEGDGSTQLKIVMPSAVVGAVIGKGGATIKAFAADSGTNISVSPKSHGNDYERVITMAGEEEQLLRAVALILSKVSENPNYVSSATMSMTSTRGLQQQFQNLGFSPPANNNGAVANGGPITEVVMTVPSNRIGAVIGKGGEIINGMKSLLSVKITVSKRDDADPNVDRTVRISGLAENVQMAQLIVNQKLSQAAANTRQPREPRDHQELAM